MLSTYQVNRLTRELSTLRAAQNASVVSNTSSTSTSFPDPTDTNANHLLSGPSHPTPSHRLHHRSSSSTSVRSSTSGLPNTAGIANSIPTGNAPAGTADRTRIGTGRHDSNPSRPQLPSRQNSITSSRRSGASSPAVPFTHTDCVLPTYTARPSAPMHREPSNPGRLSADSERHAFVASVPATGRYEEIAHHRHELEAVKRENEELKRKVRELERTLRERRQSDASRTRSESVSTTASVSRARGWEEGLREEPGEEVRVGESARGGGLR